MTGELLQRIADRSREYAHEERIQRLRDEIFGNDLTPDEVAEVLGVDRTTVMRYLREHQIIGWKNGRAWWIPEEELRAYVQRLRGGKAE